MGIYCCNFMKLMYNCIEPKEQLCEQKEHAKVIEKGKPEDAAIGIRNTQVSSSFRSLDLE